MLRDYEKPLAFLQYYMTSSLPPQLETEFQCHFDQVPAAYIAWEFHLNHVFFSVGVLAH